MILVRCCLAALFHCVLCWIWHFLRGWKNYTSPRERGRHRYQLSSSNSDIAWSKSLAPTCVRAGVSHRPTAPPRHCHVLTISRITLESGLPNMECYVVHSLIDHDPIILWLRIDITCVYLHSCTFIFKLVLVLACCLPLLHGDNLITQFHLPSKTGINWFRLHFSIRLTELDSSLGCWRGQRGSKKLELERQRLFIAYGWGVHKGSCGGWFC